MLKPLYKASKSVKSFVSYSDDTNGASSSAVEVDGDLYEDAEEAILHEHAHEEGGYGCPDPALVERQRGVVLEIMKNLGKNLLTGNFDILRLSLPVTLFEPRSYLEKLTDPWVYPYFLDKASSCVDDPVERLKWVVTWIVSGFHVALSRFEKPFNPILGETWQASLSDGTQVYMEQISHHPPISAFQLLGPGRAYAYTGVSEPSVSYKTSGLKTGAKGRRTLTFEDGGVITVDYPHYYIKNILSGKSPRAEVCGEALFMDRKNELFARVTFGKSEKALHKPMLQRNDAFQGALYRSHPATEKAGRKGSGLKAASGWASKVSKSFSMLSAPIQGASSDEEDTGNRNVSLIASCDGNWLSHLEWEGKRYWTLGDHAPLEWQPDDHPLPSDSRFRADLQALKAGDATQAQKAKEQLENMQRSDAKLRKGP